MEGPGFAPRPATGWLDVDTPRRAGAGGVPQGFPFRNGFADDGRRGGAVADSGRQ
jgi:hypothetical protein